MTAAIKRGPYDAVLCHVAGETVAREVACRTCGLSLGSNLGRCRTCFDAYADNKLTRYFDWIVHNALPPTAAKQMAQAYAEHGPLLIPR